MAEYTYADIIMDPNDPRLEGAIGKECYFSDYPKKVLDGARNNSSEYIDCLTNIIKQGVCPFVDKKGYGRTLIIIKKEPCYKERVKQWIEENDLKVGDYVKVLRKTELYENRWGSFWVDEMSDYIGKALKVLAINSLNGLISLECDDAVYDFPYFVLEKAEKPEPKYVPFETLDEFIESYKKSEERITYSNTRDYIASCGMWLRFNNDDVICAVTEIWADGVFLGHDHMKIKWKELFNFYTFMDGSPCGKEVKDE